MDVYIQLLCMLVSFAYGIFINITFHINNKLNNNKKTIVKFVVDLLYVYIVVLLYTIIIYLINNGVFHIYFLILMLIGYLISKKSVNFTTNVLKSVKNKIFK